MGDEFADHRPLVRTAQFMSDHTSTILRDVRLAFRREGNRAFERLLWIDSVTFSTTVMVKVCAALSVTAVTCGWRLGSEVWIVGGRNVKCISFFCIFAFLAFVCVRRASIYTQHKMPWRTQRPKCWNCTPNTHQNTFRSSQMLSWYQLITYI